MFMDTKSLKTARPVFDNIDANIDRLKRETSEALQKETIKHDTAIEIRAKVMSLIRAYRKTSIGKNADERDILIVSTLDMLEEELANFITSYRDRILFGKGKADAALQIGQKSSEIWSIAVADATRVDEVAELIEAGNIPNNGRNRKPGTRPEKLSVVKRAQDIVKQKQDETPQESE